MSIGSKAILASLTSHAKALGVFDRVNSHEFKAAPKNGLVLELWVDSITPLGGMSGLASTSVTIIWRGRIRLALTGQPEDGIDVRLLDATDVYLTSLVADLQLNGNAAYLDVFGLAAHAGYLVHDNVQYRVMDVTIPIVVNDVFAQKLG